MESALRAAIRFLLPIDRRPAADSPGVPSAAAAWFVPIGLAVGLAWIGVFRATWRIYGEIAGLRVLPATAVMLVEGLLTGRLLLLGLARVWSRGKSTYDRDAQWLTTLVLILVVLSEWAFLVSIPPANPWWPPQTDWRRHFNFMYPAPIYRPLLLAPLWGRWGLLVAACVGGVARHVASPVATAGQRAGVGSGASIESLCRGMSPGRLLRHAILPTALTAIYFARDGKMHVGLVIALLTFGVTYLSAMFFAMPRRAGRPVEPPQTGDEPGGPHFAGLHGQAFSQGFDGQTHDSLMAAGQIAQLVFLALYRAMWPLIHA